MRVHSHQRATGRAFLPLTVIVGQTLDTKHWKNAAAKARNFGNKAEARPSDLTLVKTFTGLPARVVGQLRNAFLRKQKLAALRASQEPQEAPKNPAPVHTDPEITAVVEAPQAVQKEVSADPKPVRKPRAKKVADVDPAAPESKAKKPRSKKTKVETNEQA